MAFLNSKEDFEALGVAPPYQALHEKVDVRDGEGHTHKWHQRGNDVFCEQGPHRHGYLVEPTKLLTGTDENGRPIYRTIDIH